MKKSIHLIIALFYIQSCMAQDSAARKLEISHVAGNVYVYTTHKMLGNTPFPSNSTYVVTGEGIVLIDTPWDTTQFQPLLDSLKMKHNQSVVLCIATHYHDDRTAGLEFLRQKGVKTYSSKHTRELCKKHNEKQSEFTFTND